MLNPQLAARQSTLEALVLAMRNKECGRRGSGCAASRPVAADRMLLLCCVLPPPPCRYVAELKFDGERIQMHRNGDEVTRAPGGEALLRRLEERSR